MVRPAPVEPTLAGRSACQPWIPRKQETTSVRESLLILVLTEPPTSEEADAASEVVDNRTEPPSEDDQVPRTLPIRLTFSGSRWSKNSEAPVSIAAMRPISSSVSRKSKT